MVLNIQAEKRLKIQRNYEAGNRTGMKKLAQGYMQSHLQTGATRIHYTA